MSRARTAAMAALVGALSGGAASANPVGPQVAHGQAALATPAPGALDVTTTPGAIINWRGFSIGAGETTRFLQQSAASAVLNRVTGADPSAILGSLLSNGRVFLVNPQGIVFGPGSVVNTAGFIASTLNISDDDFKAGRYRFDAGPVAGAIRNQGLIRSGAAGVYLIAPDIENSGVVRTDGGDLVLAAGRSVTLSSLDLGGIRVRLQAPGDRALNLGELIAERGALGIFGAKLANKGLAQANAVSVDASGRVVLVAKGNVELAPGSRTVASGPAGGEVTVRSEAGTVWAQGAVEAIGSAGRGGSVKVLGERVAMMAGSVADASGTGGGGEVLVGGNREGRGPEPNASAVYVDPAATIRADASGSDGDGGRVIVYAEDTARVHGAISARGGSASGRGGFVETSGRQGFEISVTPDTRAPDGGGEWLIDPVLVSIDSTVQSPNVTPNTPALLFGGVAPGGTLDINNVYGGLSGGQTVIINADTVSFDTVFNVNNTTGSNTLRVQANDNIFVNAPIVDPSGAAPTLSLVFDANLGSTGGGVHINADIGLQQGTLATQGAFTRVANSAIVTIDGFGGAWFENSGSLAIGRGSNATVHIKNGAILNTVGGAVGLLAGGVGQLIIDSAMWADTGPGSFNIGQDGGNGTLDVRAGSTARLEGTGSAGASGGRLRAGVGSSGSLGTVLVSGSGTKLYTIGGDGSAGAIGNHLTIGAGAGSTGMMSVTGGALVETLHLRAGQFGGGTIAFDGAGTSARVGNFAGGTVGRFEAPFQDQGGLISIGRGAGGVGALDLTNGATVIVETGGTGASGPGLQIARDFGSTGTLLVDNATLGVGGGSSTVIPGFEPFANIGRSGVGQAIVRNNGLLRVSGPEAYLNVSRGDDSGGAVSGQSTLDIQTGGRVEVLAGVLKGPPVGPGVVRVGRKANASGLVRISDAGSHLLTNGVGHRVQIGVESGSRGRIEVTSGATLDTLQLEVGRNGDGSMLVHGSGTQVFVTPGNGGFSLPFEDEGGFMRVARGAGGRGALEILAGGVVRLTDGVNPNTGRATFGPEFDIAREIGSVGAVRIDGPGSRLEIFQSSPANFSVPNIFPGPSAQVGRRGGSNLIIQNGGVMRLQGEEAFVRVSRDSVNPTFPDPNPGPITQSSAVTIRSGGQLQVVGNYARMAIADAGPAADGSVLVSGGGSKLTVVGFDSEISVGRHGTGTLTVEDGGEVDPAFLVVGEASGSNGQVTVRRGGRIFLTGEGTRDDGSPQGPFMTIGESGVGLVTVTGGSEILIDGTGQVRSPGFQIGQEQGSVGALAVSGALSEVEVLSDLAGRVPGDDTGLILVGHSGVGGLTVLNGGLVKNAPGGLTIVARKPTSVGVAIVDGPGSVFDAGDLLLVSKDFDFLAFTDLEPGGVGSLLERNGGAAKALEVVFGARTGAAQQQTRATTNQVLNAGNQPLPPRPKKDPKKEREKEKKDKDKKKDGEENEEGGGPERGEKPRMCSA